MAGAFRRLTLPQWAAQPNLGNPLLHGQLRLLHTPFSTYVQGTPTKVNGPTITQDKLGQRTTFTAASSQYIDLGSPQSLTLGDELTFFAWYNLTSVPASGSSFTLIGKDHSSGGRSYTFDVLRNDVSPSQAGARLYVNGGAGGGIGIDVAYEGRQPVAGDDRLVVITRSVARNVSAIYVDGVVGAVTTASASTPTATSTARIGSRQYTSFEGYMNGSVRLAGIINAALTTDEVVELFRDPAGQLFIPARQRIWTAPGTASGGDVTAALSGQAAAASTGTLSNSRTVAASGQAATASAGTIAPSLTIALSGQAVTASAGTVTQSKAAALSGQAVTASAGTLAPSASLALSGQAATASAGTVTYTADGNVTLALSGQAVVASAGTVAPSMSSAVSGQAATVSAGTAVAGRSISASGTQITTAAGTLTLGIVVPLAGQAAAAGAGTVTYSTAGAVTVALTGQAVEASAGTMSYAEQILSAAPIGHGPGMSRRSPSKGGSRAPQLSTRTR